MENYAKYKRLITDYAKGNFNRMLREPNGLLKYKYIVPGSVYSDSLWDWDSWLTNLALRKIAPQKVLEEYEKGCILNFLENIDDNNRMPICVLPDKIIPDPDYETNMENQNVHKPCLAQHALFICKQDNAFEWLREKFSVLEKYIDFYFENCRHETGLYYWLNDSAIGVDNDPCTFFRPDRSSASVYLNCMMYKELEAISEIARNLEFSHKEQFYNKEAEKLKEAIQEHMWDEKSGFYYSVDINLLPIGKKHLGCPRHWSCIIQRIDVWSGFMAMWAGIATKEQAKRIVNENYKNEKTFNAPYGVRTLSKMEKMYKIIKSGNPSCWLGPIWGISNYMVFEGLYNYGYLDEAKELAEKTIKMFGRDLEKNGQFHEYYDPETGEGVNNPGFQNWNLLVINMMEMIENI